MRISGISVAAATRMCVCPAGNSRWRLANLIIDVRRSLVLTIARRCICQCYISCPEMASLAPLSFIEKEFLALRPYSTYRLFASQFIYERLGGRKKTRARARFGKTIVRVCVGVLRAFVR